MKMNFEDQRVSANTGKIFSTVSFQRFFQVFHTEKMFKNCFEHLLLLGMIVFEKVF